VEEYEKEYFLGKPIPTSPTPLMESEAVEDGKVAKRVPMIGKSCSRWNGKLLWLMRGTRPDLGVLTRKCSSRISKWDHCDDALMHRGMCYLKGTYDLGLSYCGKPSDIDNVIGDIYWDSDFCGDVADTKSTSGHLGFIRGENTLGLVEWGAKGQTATALHTADAETTAAKDATSKTALPLGSLLDSLLGRTVALAGHGDNDASLAAIRRGYSKKMSYIKRTQKVSIGSLKEVWCGESPDLEDDEGHPNILLRVDSENNPSDVMTKGLPPEKHWKFLRWMGMRFKHEEFGAA